jgi:Zn-dependent protease
MLEFCISVALCSYNIVRRMAKSELEEGRKDEEKTVLPAKKGVPEASPGEELREMLRSWSLGSLFGISIKVHLTFLLLPLLVIGSSYEEGVATVAFLLALLFSVFGCVVLHELGHALMARRFGIQTQNITLYPIGGVARLERLPEKPQEELWVALAGPAVNVVIAALLTPLVIVGSVLLATSPGTPGSFLAEGLPVGVSFLASLLMANVALVLFNLLPTFPMDGGRVLRALLSFRLGLVQATAVAVSVGRILIVGGLTLLVLFAPSFLLSSPTLLLVAVFVLFLGQHELMAIRQREAHRRAALEPAPVSVLPVLPREPYPVGPGFCGYTWDQRSGIGIHWHNGRPVSTFVLPAE